MLSKLFFQATEKELSLFEKQYYRESNQEKKQITNTKED